MAHRSAPINRSTRAQREAEWAAARLEGQQHNPVAIAGRSARYYWLRIIADSNLHSSSKLVAHTLAQHGRADGSDIFPGARLLVRRASLSERVLCRHLDSLVRLGFLHRELGRVEGLRGELTKYALTAPAHLAVDVASTAGADNRQH